MSTTPNDSLEATLLLYLEQAHNFELWLAGEETDETFEKIVSE